MEAVARPTRKHMTDGDERRGIGDDLSERLSSASGALLRRERILAADTRRDLRNLRESLRLLALVLVVSAAMGAAAWLFLSSLDIVTSIREAQPLVFLLLPAVGVATAWVYRVHGKEAARGNNLVIDSAVTEREIPARMAPLTFVCSVATHLAGGSAGREGTAVQIGGTIADNVSRRFGLGERDHQDLMLSGISAAFGAVFGTPLAGAFFGMEMCFVGKIHYNSGIYCLVASFMGDAVARALGAAHAGYDIGAIPALEPASVAASIVAAVLFGLVARAFSYAIRLMKGFYAKRFTSYLVAALVGSLVVLGVYAVLGAWRYAGLSTWLVEAGFAGETGPIDPVLKLVMTALTLGAGFQGGEVTPLFGIGASLGGWLGTVVGADPSFAAALGMIGVFGAALNVPLTTIMLGIDLFGGQAAPYFVIVSFVSYLVAGHRGVYPAQRIVTPKRRTLGADEGLTVDEAIRRHDRAAEARPEEDEKGNDHEAQL